MGRLPYIIPFQAFSTQKCFLFRSCPNNFVWRLNLEKFKPGLKKDVTAIFQGVRIPNNVHPHQSPGASVPNRAGDFGQELLSPDRQTSSHQSPQPRLWFPQENSARKRSKFATLLEAFKQLPLRIFRPRSALSQKRRISISKHLLD